MPIGILVNVASVLMGGILGSAAGAYIPARFNKALTSIFGLSAILIGISMIGQMDSLSAVILSLILGGLAGEAAQLERSVNRGITVLARRLPGSSLSDEQRENIISMIVLFCFSGTGWFGSMNAGITGDHSILFAKSIMDFFTAAIFGAASGYLVGLIAIPQCAVFLALFYMSKSLMPLMTAGMIGDFKAVGGIITLALGLKLSGIRHYDAINLLPAIILVFFISHLWSLLPF
ncbi:DUF554 domain-containing protein [Oscillibacter sp.]|jgi:uncharacterized membrane protein YqgA involved in biofilm formation|uniref:DUF554 domain-containing protein n=1 Tax=Oscillibacter sp. TaxID=1945593 RepID=UPI00261C3F2E|nr:DUF554 domain-containing protein [Oscillibacter sp.]